MFTRCYADCWLSSRNSGLAQSGQGAHGCIAIAQTWVPPKLRISRMPVMLLYSYVHPVEGSTVMKLTRGVSEGRSRLRGSHFEPDRQRSNRSRCRVLMSWCDDGERGSTHTQTCWWQRLDTSLGKSIVPTRVPKCAITSTLRSLMMKIPEAHTWRCCGPKGPRRSSGVEYAHCIFYFRTEFLSRVYNGGVGNVMNTKKKTGCLFTRRHAACPTIGLVCAPAFLVAPMETGWRGSLRW